MRKKLLCPLLSAVLVCPFIPMLSSCKTETPKNAYSINAEYLPEEGKLKADMTATLVNTSENVLSELKFELYMNAYREGAKHKPVSENFESICYYDGASYGSFEITSLTGGEYEICGEDENILSVTPLKPIYPDETATVTLSYELTLPKAAHRLGIGKNAVNLAYFYPVLCNLTEGGFEEYVYSYAGDPFVSAMADYTVSMTVPKEYTLVHGGTGGGVEQGDKTVYTVRATDVREIAFVLGKDFQCLSQKVGDTTVEYYYQLDDQPEAALAAACDALSFYEKTFTPYGYERYVLAETDFIFGGMEYSTLALIASGLHDSEKAAVIAHETAHQWWYFKVGSDQVNESWQDEGLSEYSTALFFEEYPSYESSYAERVALSERSYRAYFSVYSQLGGANTKMSRPLSDYTGEYEYRCIAYDKGVIMFDRVRETMGDKKFFSALKDYAQTYDKKQATRSDLISCFEEQTNIEGLFVSFLDGLCVI